MANGTIIFIRAPGRAVRLNLSCSALGFQYVRAGSPRHGSEPCRRGKNIVGGCTAYRFNPWREFSISPSMQGA